MHTLIRGLCFLSVTALLACSSSESDWDQANTQATLSAYQNFLARHPHDPHETDARQRIQMLQDDQAWKTAQDANTDASYQNYAFTHPTGAHFRDAYDHLMASQRMAEWQHAKDADTAAALRAFLQEYPQGPESDQARTELQRFDSVVDLGTFHNEQAADQAELRLEGKFRNDLQSVVVVPPSAGGHAYGLTSADMTADQAKAACAPLSKAHQHCEVIHRRDQTARGTAG